MAASDFGPELLSALRRLASICLYEVIENRPPNWVRFVILIRQHQLRLAEDVSLAKEREPRRQRRYRSCPTTRLHHHSDALRDGVRDRVGQ